MKTLRLLHRWTGGLIGLLLAVLGLTGTLLLHEDAFLRATLPHARDAQVQDGAALAAAATRIFGADHRPRSMVLATDRLGLHKLSYKGEHAAYADQTGQIVAAWTSNWARPEVWLFDLHHHLFNGDTGEIFGGIAGLTGLAFVFTGLILWWPTRRLFAARLWPKKASRAAIIHHHRDLGVLVAPLLILSLTTGAAMNLKWFSQTLRAPFTPPAVMEKASAAPKPKGGKLSSDLNWRAMIQAAQTRYPGAELRVISLPAKTGGLIQIRMRQQPEWLPNGRTMMWFDPADGRVLGTRDAQTLPLGSRIANLDYPLHAAKVGGLPYRLVMTISGLTLTVLGSLAVVTFWGNPSGAPRRRQIYPKIT
jgi:uncharacterized iron-regulated membrane protein